MPKVTIIDYGVGNLQSLRKVFAALGADTVFSEDAKDIDEAKAVILPGVGAFAAGMRGLEIRGLIDAVKKFARSGKPMLGICLGAQLLFSKGFEFGEHDGLGIIQGQVVRFPELAEREKIPHVGWNRVSSKNVPWSSGIFQSFSEPFDAYFVHSYICVPDDAKNILSVTSYGGMEFCSALKVGNVFGTQFHPEKSGEAGLAIMKNFLKLIP